MQFRSRVVIATIGAFLAASLAQAGVGTTVNTFKVVAVATLTHEGVTRTIGELEIGRDTITVPGDTLPTAATPAVPDTSIVYPSQYWESLTLQSKFRPRATPANGGADSAGIKIYLEQSNDGENFVIVDSLCPTDSNWSYKNMGVQHWAYSRFRIVHTARMDSAGAYGQIIGYTWGRF